MSLSTIQEKSLMPWESVELLMKDINVAEESIKKILDSTTVISDNITHLSATGEEVAASSTEGLRMADTQSRAWQSARRYWKISISLRMTSKTLLRRMRKSLVRNLISKSSNMFFTAGAHLLLPFLHIFL